MKYSSSHIFKITLGALAISTGIANATVIAEYTAAENDRFNNNASFIGNIGGNTDSFSGVGRGVNGGRRSATMIGSNYFISANHQRPLNGDVIAFYSNNNPAGPSYTYTVAGGKQVGNTDLYIGYFNVAVDASVKRYNFSRQSANTLGQTNISGQLFTQGWGGANYDTVAGDGFNDDGRITEVRVGKNNAEAFLNEGSSTVTVNGVVNTFNNAGTPVVADYDQLLLIYNESSDTDYVKHESILRSGDSGGPLFSIVGGEMQLEGVALGTGQVNGRFQGGLAVQERSASYYSYIGSYANEIDTIIANDIPDPVPEPSSLALLGLSALGILRRKR